MCECGPVACAGCSLIGIRSLAVRGWHTVAPVSNDAYAGDLAASQSAAALLLEPHLHARSANASAWCVACIAPTLCQPLNRDVKRRARVVDSPRSFDQI